MGEALTAPWSRLAAEVLASLGNSTGGLSSSEAARRLRDHGPNRLSAARRSGPLVLLLSQFMSPITVLLPHLGSREWQANAAS
jgi:Mg2+-importing ATPase